MFSSVGRIADWISADQVAALIMRDAHNERLAALRIEAAALGLL
jgi:hypothetical protein